MESPYVTSYYSLIVTLAVSAIVFEIFTLKARKITEFSHPTLLWGPHWGNPLEFLDETYPVKTRGEWEWNGKNLIILTSTVFLWYHCLTDGQTDGVQHLMRPPRDEALVIRVSASAVTALLFQMKSSAQWHHSWFICHSRLSPSTRPPNLTWWDLSTTVGLLRCRFFIGAREKNSILIL